MPRELQMTNNNGTLHTAKFNKKDEFYTQLCDIESELQYYESHFENKVVYCNCDDPRYSNFYRYFINNFEKLKLKKVICAGYNISKSGQGAYHEYTGVEDVSDIPNSLKYFDRNGDFRSFESITLLKECDIVVTNPPFSLFREYVAQLVNFKKSFLIIGNVNAITYKEIFGWIKENRVWLGINLGRGVSGFIVPSNYELYGTETKIDNEGNRIISPNNCLWLTNLDNHIRHEKIPLVKKYTGFEEKYPHYDNYDAINVNKTSDIPVDYPGVMGVPITFLHKFNPDQFEIIKFRKGNDDKDLSINGKCPYFRILVRRIDYPTV